MRNLFVSVGLALSFFGCMVGLNYRQPSVEIPVSWRFEEGEAKEVVNPAWWEMGVPFTSFGRKPESSVFLT